MSCEAMTREQAYGFAEVGQTIVNAPDGSTLGGFSTATYLSTAR